MYKGIVLKVTTEYAVVIAEDNSYCKIAFKEGLIPGQKIYFFEEDILISVAKYEREEGFKNFRKKAVALSVMAACIVFFILFNGVPGLESKGSSYFAVVSVDINPSVELRLNEGCYVIGVETLNQDGKKVAGDYLLGLTVDKAVSQIVKKAEEMNYLNSESDTVLMATALNSVETGRIEELMTQLTNIQLPEEYGYLIIPMERDEIEKAKENKLSLGKYALLDLAGESFQAYEVRNMKVKDLVTSKTIKEKLQEKQEKNQIKNKTKKVEDKKVEDEKVEDKKAKDKNTAKNNPAEKVTLQGPYLENKQDNGKQDSIRQFITEKEPPGQGKNTNKGKPNNEELKIKQ